MRTFYTIFVVFIISSFTRTDRGRFKISVSSGWTGGTFFIGFTGFTFVGTFSTVAFLGIIISDGTNTFGFAQFSVSTALSTSVFVTFFTFIRTFFTFSGFSVIIMAGWTWTIW